MASRGLFCGCKLGWSGESQCYSRKGLFSSTFLLCQSSLPLLLCIDISDLPREEKVWCLLLVKKERQHCPFLLSVSQWASCYGACVYVFSISPPDHISFDTMARHKLVEPVLRVIVRLTGKLFHCCCCACVVSCRVLSEHTHSHTHT